jgi:putative FmdB family regulatory protein
MPTYEYECSACGHAFEALQAITDPKLTDCPQCKQKKLARLIGRGSGVIFKGSGFYETDYKRKSEPRATDSKPCCDSGSCPMKDTGTCGAG